MDLDLHHHAPELIVFVGDAAHGARRLAEALRRLGYATAEASTIAEIGGARAPFAVVVSAREGIDPFRAVREVRARARYAHSLVFAWTPAHLDMLPGVAVAAGAEDMLSADAPLADSVDRVAGRIARSRMLLDRATFDCVTHTRGRLFVSEWLSAEIGLAVERHGVASFAIVWLAGFAALRSARGLLAGEREVETAAFALSAAIRPRDLPCRLADDTFIVVMPGVAVREAGGLLDEARQRMAAKAPALGEIAIGITEAPRAGMTWQALFDLAEARLRTPSSTRERVQPARTGSDRPAL